MLERLKARLLELEREYGVAVDNVEVAERQLKEAQQRQQQVIGACLAVKQLIVNVEDEAREKAEPHAAEVAGPSVPGRRPGSE